MAHSDYRNKVKDEMIRFAWDVASETGTLEAYQDSKKINQVGGIGVFSDALIGVGPWKGDVEEDYRDEDLKPKQMEEKDHHKPRVKALV